MRVFTILGLAIAIGLGTALAPFASSSPDGLQKVASRTAFVDRGHSHEAPVAGYAFPGVRDARLATGLSGFAGTVAVFLVGYGVAALMRRRTA
jgi:hypothetical protein